MGFLGKAEAAKDQAQHTSRDQQGSQYFDQVHEESFQAVGLAGSLDVDPCGVAH